MELSEALRASKVRRAEAYNKDEGPLSPLQSTLKKIFGGIPIAEAHDGGVSLWVYTNEFPELVEKYWADLLPSEFEFVMGLDWQPVEPKHPLRQLADILTDWSEDV